MHNKERRKKIKLWNKYFRQKLKIGLSWQNIRNHLIIRKGYPSRIIELLIYNYRLETEKELRKRVTVAGLACILVLAIIVPMAILKPTIIGKVIGEGGNVYYVDSVNGNDANDGLSEAAPLKTIAKVNSLSLHPGDTVLFKRGGMWRSSSDAYLRVRSGSSYGNITYGAYGRGEKPLFLASHNLSSTTNWPGLGGNIWRSNGNLSVE